MLSFPGLSHRFAARPCPLVVLIAISFVCSAPSIFGQQLTCPSIAALAATDADKAYSQKRYADAESLFASALTQRPNDIQLTASLVRTLLQEGKIAKASDQINGLSPQNAQSAIALTALAEVQLQQGLPWLAIKSIDASQAVDPCYARSHLMRSRVMRIDSMYASERAEIQRAFEIDPADPDIHEAWQQIVSAADEVTSIDQSLATLNNLDPKARQTAEAATHSLMLRLSENSQTCQVSPTVPTAKIPLVSSEDKAQHSYRYHLEVDLPQGKARLLVDTAASGLFISRALAQQNNLHQGVGDPQGTVYVDHVRIGPLDFRDCTVGVSDAPLPANVDGFIGTDVFASYLITLDFRSKRLSLELLPPPHNLLPVDRSVPPALKDSIAAYHRHQLLLLPVTLDSKSQYLFVLGTGMPYTAMASDVAHSLSNLKVDFTNSERTASGAKEEFYRDKFNLDFARLPQFQRRRIAAFDLSAMDQSAGFQIAGILGLDVLHSLVLHLDYRDGLVKFELPDQDIAPIKLNETSTSIGVN